MALLILILLGLAVGGYAYQSGKRYGSRAGYVAGRRNQRLPRH